MIPCKATAPPVAVPAHPSRDGVYTSLSIVRHDVAKMSLPLQSDASASIIATRAVYVKTSAFTSIERHCHMSIRTLLALLLVASPAQFAAAAPVQWNVNGNFYELVQPSSGINWTDAEAAAAASSYLGRPGRLVTVNSSAEHNFLITNLLEPASPVGTGNPLFVFAWIGLREVNGEGDWQWITGEPLSFTAWDGGEPNNSGGNEAWAHYQDRFGTFAWNDTSNIPTFFNGLKAGYLVEYPVIVPEPSTALLMMLSVLFLGLYRWRTVGVKVTALE